MSKNVDASQLNAFEHACQQNGYKKVAGVDEAGRGALAGPVVAAAVILPHNCHITGLKDSKQLTPKRRAQLFDEIQRVAVSVGVGSADPDVIARRNILGATLVAMKEAVAQLTSQPDYLLVDGLHLPETGIVGEAIPKGDSLSCSIAAASIIAKTTRDRLMIELHQLYPNYGFAQHKGYPTRQHRQAIVESGPSEVHRATFKLLADES